ILPRAPIRLPACVYREVEYGEARCRDHTTDRLFPIRFLWLLEGNEQRLWEYTPLGRSRYHPEKLLEVWQRVLAEPAFRRDREAEGFRFDLDGKAMNLTTGWIYIGESFAEDFLEVEAVLGVELLFPVSDLGDRQPAFQEIKRSRGWPGA